jgi:hypothetical protein
VDVVMIDDDVVSLVMPMMTPGERNPKVVVVPQTMAKPQDSKTWFFRIHMMGAYGGSLVIFFFPRCSIGCCC